PFDNPPNINSGYLLNKVLVVSGVFNPSMTQDLEARALRIIHEEECNPIVGRQIARGEHLAIARVIGESERLGIQHSKEPGMSATMLDIGPTAFANGCNIKTVPRLDE